MRRHPIAILAAFVVAHVAGADVDDLVIVRRDAVRVHFTVESAREPATRARGQLWRTALPPMAGMLFDFRYERDIRMWMKNTLIPLDMVFADDRGVIVHIVRDARPHATASIGAPVPARYVLEINAGTAARLAIGVGDRIVF